MWPDLRRNTMIFVLKSWTPTAAKADGPTSSDRQMRICRLYRLSVSSPEPALHEGTGHDDHQDSCRIEHIVSLVHIVFLRQFVVELQVKRRIADDNIENVVPDSIAGYRISRYGLPGRGIVRQTRPCRLCRSRRHYAGWADG